MWKSKNVTNLTSNIIALIFKHNTANNFQYKNFGMILLTMMAMLSCFSVKSKVEHIQTRILANLIQYWAYFFVVFNEVVVENPNLHKHVIVNGNNSNALYIQENSLKFIETYGKIKVLWPFLSVFGEQNYNISFVFQEPSLTQFVQDYENQVYVFSQCRS